MLKNPPTVLPLVFAGTVLAIIIKLSGIIAAPATAANTLPIKRKMMFGANPQTKLATEKTAMQESKIFLQFELRASGPYNNAASP